MAYCPICEEELYEENPGVDNWDDDGGEGGFIVRELTCQNEDCPLFEKRQDWFFDFSRVDVEGDDIDILCRDKDKVAAHIIRKYKDFQPKIHKYPYLKYNSIRF